MSAEEERATIVKWARRRAQTNHRFAAESAHLRREYIALSSAYISIAEAIESGAHLSALDQEGGA